MARFDEPSVLVLGGGGILGEAWMSSLLAGLEDATGFDPRGCDAYLGTSAGSIVAAALAAGVDPRSRLGRLPEPPAVNGGDAGGGSGPRVAFLPRLALGAGRAVVAPLAVVGLHATETGGALVRRLALARVPAGRRSLAGLGREVEASGTHFDGRLAVSAVDADSGRRVMFGMPGAPEAGVGEAVEASCAIPGVFRPVKIGGRRYVDGGAWSPTNLDRAPVSRGTRVLCLNPTGALSPTLRSPAAALAVASRSIAGVEALALERRGAHVTIVRPDDATVAVMGGNLMDPRPRDAVVAAGLAQGRALGR